MSGTVPLIKKIAGLRLPTRKNSFIIFLFNFIFSNTIAQSVDWVNHGGGAGYDAPSELAEDNSGNYYTTGQIANTAVFNGTTVNGGLFIAKYDSTGMQQWVTAEANDHAYGKSICLDHSGNIYVIGWMDSTVMFGGTLLTLLGKYDMILSKYNSSGQLLWVKKFGGSKGDKGVAIVRDHHDNLYFAGYFSGTAQFGNFTVHAVNDSSDVFLAKCDTAGTIQWVEQAGGILQDQANSICVNESGDIFVSGAFQLTSAFANLSVTSHGEEDFFIAKYDSAGTIQWVQTAGTPYPDHGFSVCADAAGNSYVAGNFQGSITFGNFDLSGFDKDLFVASYSPLGICRWAKQIVDNGNNTGADISINEAGKIFVGGGFHTIANFNGLTVTSAGDRDMLAARYDSLGNVEAILSAGGIDDDVCFAVVSDENNTVVMAGLFTDSVAFGNDSLVSNGGADVVIAKMELATLTITSVSDSVLCPAEQFDMSYTADGYFDIGNIFTAELSNSSGDFTNPSALGNFISTTSGVVHCTAPWYATSGSNYRIRLVSTNQACAAWNTTPIIYSEPFITISGPASVCTNDTALLIASGGVVYSWVPANNLSSSTNDSVYAFPDTTTTFNVVGTDDYGCSGWESKTLTITTSGPTIEINAVGPTSVCANQTAHLSANYLNGQTYQWKKDGTNIPGAVSTSYYANQTGTYTCVATNSCGDSTSNAIEILVNPLPIVTIGSFLPVCQNSAPFTLSSGLPSGGIYSGSYVSNGVFSPSAIGNWTITYSYTDSNNCLASASTALEVVALPMVTFTFSPVSFCETDAPVTLSGGDPLGGTYDGTGVSNGVFDPGASGPGTFTISYTYTDISGCSKTESKIFTVYEMPDVSLTMDSMVCINISPFTLTGGLPSGGTYYIDGSMSSVFDPALLGEGYHDVVYKVADSNCIVYDTVTVLINVCTGINEITQSPFIELYPNPACDAVIMETLLHNTGWSIELYDAFGVCLKKIPLDNKEGNIRIPVDIHTLSRGIYWLVLMNDSQRYFRKLVLE
ncbi:MAG TPA: T9SS type A sorting domain-containing protein [Chitinophagales bacterium]|nr:T9SS type A sorting domain-containing protein [Chitinophagales bacterium]